MKSLCLAIALLASVPLTVAEAVAQDGPKSLKLWPQGAPGPRFAPAGDIVQQTKDIGRIVTHVQQPSITPFLPAPGAATGAAVIIAPGGGHRQLSIDLEGYRVAEWLSAHGVAAFVLEYRLSKEPGAPYTVEGDELNDARRAIRTVRARAAEWHIAPDRIGIMGFSAGGELAALSAWRVASASNSDAVDHENARPDFVALIYPGIPAQTSFTNDLPPAFLLAGEKDRPTISEALPQLYLSLKQAGVPVELHMIGGAGHGFGIRDGNPPALAAWPQLFLKWMDGRGLLKPQTAGKP